MKTIFPTLYLAAFFFLGLSVPEGTATMQRDARLEKVLEEYRQLREDMAKSIFKIEQKEVVATVKTGALQPAQRRQLDLVKLAYEHIRKYLSVHEGAKIVYRTVDASTAEIIFDSMLKENEMGPEYVAKVTINTKTKKIVKALAGS